VLLATEGTYPFYTGGVSTWCHRLISQLPQLNFNIYGVVTNPYAPMKYELPSNVRKVQKVPLWGMMQPAEYSSHHSFSQHLKSLMDTTPEAIAQRFLPLWESLLYGILTDRADLNELAETLRALNRYFQQFSYQKTWASPMVWSAFKNAITAAFDSRPPDTQDPTVAETKQAFRLLYHFLTVLYFPVPSADITHSSAAGFCGIPCILAKLEHGTPFLLTEHGVYLREQYLNLRRQVKSFFVRWLLYRTVTAIVRLNYHFADQVSPVCAYNARWERELGTPAERIRVIFNGADPQRFLPCEPQPKQRPLVANVGLIYPLKGQLDLIEAAALVRDKVPDVEFRLYGSASDTTYYAQCLEKISRLGLERTVIFAGVTQQPWQVYSDADVVAFASISEGFPYVVVEAMLCGAAVVSTDVGGVREALADTGLLVRPRSPQELAQSICFLLDAPEERLRLGEQARIRALAHFTEEEFLGNYLRTYHELCSRRPRPLLTS
jgi:glycosyltransferase involved in cell wall biosynthesis